MQINKREFLTGTTFLGMASPDRGNLRTRS